MMPNAWQYRLFILSKDGVLTYYDTEVPENKDIFESKERGRIDLRAVKYELLTEATEGAPSPHTIIIAPDESEKWKLCADTKEDHIRWWKAIEKFSHEHTETKAAHLNIQSDDDFDMASPRNSRTRKSQILNSRSIDPDVTAVSNVATPLASTQGTSSFGAFPTSALPTTTSTKPKSSSRKGGLRVGKETAMLSQEWIEWALVMVIVNLCLLGIIRTTAVLDRVVYVGVLNLVVAHSLYLRAHRCTSSVTSALAAASSTAASVVATTSTELTAVATAAGAVVPGLNTLTSLTSAATTATGTATDAVSAGRSLMSQGKKPVAGILPAFAFLPSSIYGFVIHLLLSIWVLLFLLSSVYGFYSLFLSLYMGFIIRPFSLLINSLTITSF